LPEQGVPTNKNTLTVRPSTVLDEDLNPAGALIIKKILEELNENDK
jgi:hypothetical protein